jgi:hypothetical protein
MSVKGEVLLILCNLKVPGLIVVTASVKEDEW